MNAINENLTERGLLRFITAGSVDDGKSTLIGRLLFDSKGMERDGQLQGDRTGIYTLAQETGFIAGKVSAHRDGFGFVIPDDNSGDLFLNDKEM